MGGSCIQQNLIPDDQATVIPVILSLDKTHLTTFSGNQKAHPVYVTVGNLPKHIHCQPSKRGRILIGYLPVPKLDCETNLDKRRAIKRQLFPHCLHDLLALLAEAV
jgi:hypothetical protein